VAVDDVIVEGAHNRCLMWHRQCVYVLAQRETYVL